MARLGVLLVGGLCALLLNMCSGANNPVTGVVQADVAGHHVVVTDCYLLDVPPVEHLRAAPGADAANGARWRFAPCSDAIIVIAGDQLTVNGVGYGAIAPGDDILVDHGDVYVNGQPRTTI
mgnify:CR=1 FL=1